MKLRLTILSLLLLLCASCVQEPVLRPDAEDQPVDVTLSFGPCDAALVSVSTRSTLGIAQESRVNNLYVFIFDANGKKLYGHFFDSSNYGEPSDADPNWWEVTNIASESDGETHGKIHLKTVTKHSCTIVGIANINADMLGLSPGQMSNIQKISELESIKVGLNQTDIGSSGFFLMTGRMDGVDIVRDPDATTQHIDGTLVLRRLNAKIQFNVQVAPDSPISSFTFTKWELVNQPKTSYLLERGGYLDGGLPVDSGTAATDFMRSGELNYETTTVTNDYYSGSTDHIIRYGFSFYMMENRFAPLATPLSYADRDRQQKLNLEDLGAFSSVENGDFLYADPRSAYVIIRGNVTMDLTAAQAGSTLSADVRYLIHLGDFASSLGDFSIFRNHNYIYNIYIRNVNDIVAEVDANYEGDPAQRLTEPEPGATGKVVVATEEVYTSDSHYNSHVISFHAKNLDAENITWYVETPFNPKGASPTVVDGYEYTEGVDYEWVEFRVNEMEDDGLYSENRQRYMPRPVGMRASNRTMNITELVSYLKRQRLLYDEDLHHAGEAGYVRKSDFDFDSEENGGPKINVTAFVNEYYYEEHPLEHRYIKDLWKQFVNQPMRYLHILSRTRKSADGESLTFGASFTIRQKSIQCVYNINDPTLASAWGAETSEEEYESGATLYMKGWSKGKIPTHEDRGNTSTTNGRLNTLKEWKMLDKNGNVLYLGQEDADEAQWETYLNLTAANDDYLLRKDSQADYRYLRYSCMSRNRDNNGNGVIDPEEVRWYMGADTQLMGLFLGAYGIEGEARLYQKSAEDQLSNDRNVWRQHVVASTRYSGRDNSDLNARCIWAEEGVCGSDLSYYGTSDGSTDIYTTRCVRNLGYYIHDGQEEDITYAAPQVEPTPVIQVTRMRRMPSGDVAYPTGSYNQDVYYIFDCSRVNQASLREPVNHELIGHDENDKAACLYAHFESIPASESVAIPTSLTFEGKTYQPQYVRQMNQYLDATWGILSNPFCPPGYRLPNVREDAIIWNFIPSTDKNYLSGLNNHSRTHWSFGADGAHSKSGLTSWGWSVSQVKILMANVLRDDQRTSKLRCVRDLPED